MSTCFGTSRASLTESAADSTMTAVLTTRSPIPAADPYGTYSALRDFSRLIRRLRSVARAAGRAAAAGAGVADHPQGVRAGSEDRALQASGLPDRAGQRRPVSRLLRRRRRIRQRHQVFGARLKGSAERASDRPPRRHRPRPVPLARQRRRLAGARRPGVAVLCGALRRPGSTSRIQAKVSRDHAETWSDAFPLALDEGMMVRNRPSSSRTATTCCRSTTRPARTPNWSGPTARRCSSSMTSRPGPGRRPAASRRGGNIQPAVVELSPGT